jgi:hypothetical protein
MNETGSTRVKNEKYVQNSKFGKLNSVAVVQKRTIPTGRPPLVGEVSANL